MTATVLRLVPAKPHSRVGGYAIVTAATRAPTAAGFGVTDAKISKNGKGKDATWTVSYTLRETRTEELF